jgi:hypothetical protein
VYFVCLQDCLFKARKTFIEINLCGWFSLLTSHLCVKGGVLIEAFFRRKKKKKKKEREVEYSKGDLFL